MMRMTLLILVLASFSATASNFAGQLKATVDDYPYNLGPPTEDVVPYISLELSDKYKLSKKFRFQWKLFALTNTESRTPPENFYGDAREAFFEYKSGGIKLRAGMNTLNWGVVDVSSPADVTNSEALFQPLRIFRQGAPTVEAILGGEGLNLDLVYIPVQRAPQLPSVDSRWLPRRFLLNIPGQLDTIYLPNNIAYTYAPPQTLDHALNNNYGAKLASHQGSVDMQVTYFEGASPTPKILPTGTINLDFGNQNQLIALSPIEVGAINYRVRTTGAGFVWAREKWIFRGESAYQSTVSKNSELQPWSWANVLGVETNVDLGSSTVTWLAQIYYTKNPQAPDNLISSTYRLFDQTGVLGARWAYSESLTLLASALYATQTQGLYWTAGFDQKLSDHLKWGLSWHNFSAGKPGLIKTYQNNSYGSLELTYFL